MTREVLKEPRIEALAAEVSHACGAAVCNAEHCTSFDELSAALLDHAREASSSVIIGIAGFPGSGKTTLAKALVEVLNRRAASELAAHLPMDGYHRTNRDLAALRLEHKKGAPETYDVPAYAAALALFKQPTRGVLRFPDYDRSLHEVVEGAINIPTTVKVLVTEGLYVGSTHELWRAPSALIDRLYFVDVPLDVCLSRIVDRNIEAGRGPETIRAKLENDLSNSRTIVQTLNCRPILIRTRSREGLNPS